MEIWSKKDQSDNYSKYLCNEIFFYESCLRMLKAKFGTEKIDYRHYLNVAYLESTYFSNNEYPPNFEEFQSPKAFDDLRVNLIINNIYNAQKNIEVIITHHKNIDHKDLFVYYELLGDLEIHIFCYYLKFESYEHRESLFNTFLYYEGEIIQCIKIPVEFLSRIQNYENGGIRNKIQKRLFNISRYGELVQKGGIYIFCDPKIPSIKRQIYVGESNELLTRLKNHEKTKQGNLSSILIITSSGDEIGKDMLKVLESMLIRSLKEHLAFEVINKQKKTKFQVDIFDEPVVKKYHETILHLIERNC